MIFFLSSLARDVRKLVTEDDTTESFWLRLHNVKVGDEYPYRDLTMGVIKMLCLPFSNAEVERIFSAMTHYKSKLRSWMSTDLLEAIMYCKFGLKWMGVKLAEFEPPLELLNYYPAMLYKDTHAQYMAKND